MDQKFHFLVQHGYLVTFFWVLAEQCGVPIPAFPVLLAAGALTGTGQLSFGNSLLLALLASVLADLGWYQLGRAKGIKVLHLLCRISLEPDSCVRQTETAFARQGARSLLIAKFIPGLNTAAPPLAGIFKMPLRRFLIYDMGGAVLWVGGTLLIGRLFSRQIESIATRAVQLGGSVATVVAVLLALYIGWKILQRELFLRELRIARIEPAELKQMMDSGEEVMIVDLRHELDFASEPQHVLGALRISPDELEHRHSEIPRDRDIILYCT